MTILLRQKPLPQVVRQIVQRDNGAWFDPSDLSTLYQDAAGTIPVTAVEQPVGLMLDKSQGMMLGPELQPTGDISGFVSGQNEIVWSNTTFTNTIVSRGVSKPLLSVGKFYSVTVNLNSNTVVSLNTADAITPSTRTQLRIGSGTTIFKADYPYLYIRNAEPGTTTINSLTVRELYGYHATQNITASRPTLSARYNLLTKTEDFNNSAWVKDFGGVGSTPVVTQNYATAPDGTMTATRIVYALNGGTASTDYSRVYQAVTLSANTQTSLGVWVKSANGQTKDISISMTGADPKVVSVGVDWVFVSNNMIRSDTNYLLRFELRGIYGVSDSADILIWHPDLRRGTSPGPYQRVDTATDYDTVGFPKYIKAEGVDDHFVLPYLGLYNNASCSIIASHSSSSQAANGVIVSEASSTDADTKYLPYRQLASAGNVDSYIAADNAAVILDSTGAAYSGTKENIIESIIDSGTSIETYRSGVLLSNEPYTRSATLTLNNTTLFGSVSTTNTNFLNTKLYGLIITKSNLSARDRSLCETYLKSKVQVLQV